MSQRKIAQKVASKYLSKTLRDKMQAVTSDARVQVDAMQTYVGRALALVEESEHKEVVYKEAGDMISGFQTSLATMQESLAQLSYIINHMSLSSTGQDLNPAMRKELDRLLHARITDPAQLQGLPTFLEDVPEAIRKREPSQNSIYDVDMADDVSKENPERQVIDYSDFSVSFGKPDVQQGDVP
jgi:hypothetical protein